MALDQVTVAGTLDRALPRVERRTAATLLRLGPATALLAIGLALLPGLRFQVGLDGLSYLSLAQYVSEGRFDLALNPYWSPLLSWLIAPLLLVGVSPIVAGHVVVLTSALTALLAVRRLALLIGAPATSADLVALVTVPLLVAMLALGVFADLLLAALLLVHLGLVLDPALTQRPRRAWIAGGVAGLAVLAKTYALPFVLTLLLTVAVLHRLAGGRPRQFGVIGLRILLAATLVVAPWLVALSLHMGSPTLSRAAGYNVQLVAPDSPGNPIRWAGLLPVPHDRALSVWEDPSGMQVPADWRSADASESGQRLVENVARNGRLAVQTLLDQAAPVLVAVIAGLTMVRWSRRTDPAWRTRLGLLAAAAIGLGGYLPLWMEERYLWLPLLALLPFAALLLARLGRLGGWRFSRLQVATVIALLVLTAVPAAERVAAHWGAGASAAELAGRLRASDRLPRTLAASSNWQRSAVLCLHLDCRFLGIPRADDPVGLRRELQAAGVDSFLVWDAASDDLRPAATPAARTGGSLLFDLRPS